VPGKRLFWVAIIIVELVLVYVLWRPVRDRFNPHRRAAVNTPALRSPENHSFESHLPNKRQPELSQPSAKQAQVTKPLAKQPEARRAEKHPPVRQPQVQTAQVQPPQAAVPSRKPSAGIRHSATAPQRKSVVITAGLKAPEPVPAKPVPATPTPIPPPPASIADSFWCNLSRRETVNCDCKGKDGEQTAHLTTH
jgi:hypothetical protein